MRINGYGIIKKGIAVGLIALMACLNPLQTLSPANIGMGPTEAKAAEDTDKPYIAEVRLAVDKDVNHAIQLLDEEGYEVIEQDLNEKAGAYWNELGDQSVVMGIKRTADQSKAIRDMKTMNMLGKYSFTGLKERIENNKTEAKNTYKKIRSSISEYKKNYEKNDLGAQTAHDLMNMYRDDDSGKLMGDLFLEDLNEEQVLKLLSDGNLHILGNIFKSLAYGVEASGDEGNTWMERLSKVTSYNAVVRKYAKEIYGTDTVYGDQKAEVEAIVESDLNDAATTILSNWGEIRKNFTDAEDDEKVLEDFDGEFEDTEELLDVSESAGNIEAVSLAKSLPYGKKTVYDYFTVSTATFEKNIKNLYPLAYALSEGQRSMMELTDMSTLIQAALIRSTAGEDRSKLDDSVETAQKTISEVEVVSVYDGVDRSMYDDEAAMTSQATANMSVDSKSQEEIENSKAWLYGCVVATGVTSLLAAGCAIASKMFSNTSRASLNVVENTFRTSKMMEFNSFQSNMRNSNAAKVCSGRLACFAKVMAFVAVITLVVSAIQFYRTMINEYNTKQLPIPKILVDYDVEGSSGRNVVYHVVKWNRTRNDGRADRADLNGDAGREWLALYTTTDEAMGEPILADSIVAKTGDAGGDKTPGIDYKPLSMFGRESVQNLVDEEYSYRNKVGGIYLWYQKSAKDEERLIDDIEDDVAASDTDVEDQKNDAETETTDAEAETTGSNIAGGNTAILVTAGAVGGFIIGMICMFFIRRKKVAPVSSPEDKK